MSDIDRNDPLWKALSSVCSVDDAYLIATRHRDEAVAKMDDDLACMSKTLNEYTGIIADLDKQVDRYRADAERLETALAELKRVRAMYGNDRTVSVDQIRTMECNATTRLMDIYNTIDAARAAEQERK